MTKTLTEQWREGKLPEDTYYVRFICGRYGVYEFEQFKGFGFDNDFAYIKEVVATVPSYDEYNKLRKLPLKCFQLEEDNSALMVINKDMCKEIERLQEQLKIATKALKEYMTFCRHPAKEALKEMEGVK